MDTPVLDDQRKRLHRLCADTKYCLKDKMAKLNQGNCAISTINKNVERNGYRR